MSVRILTEPEKVPDPKKLLSEIIEPDIQKFEKHFQKVSSSTLTQMEKEILRAYLFFKIVVQKNEQTD